MDRIKSQINIDLMRGFIKDWEEGIISTDEFVLVMKKELDNVSNNTTSNRLFKIIDGEEFSAFDSEDNFKEFETGVIVEFIENEDNIFKFCYEENEYWQFWYSIEEFVEEIK